jgi:hypothetical protein
MATDPKIESYLARLDKALGPVPVSDRAEIVTEIKSHVLSAKDSDPGRSIDSILESMGAPETVANKYLMEKGLKPGKAPKDSMVKWLVIGFLGTVGIATAAMMFLMLYFSPLIKVEEKEGRVEILGGLIKIHEDSGNISVGGISGRKVQGERKVTDARGHELKLVFSNGKVDVENSENDVLRWSCKSATGQEVVKESGNVVLLDFSGTSYVKCDLQVPRNLTVSLKGDNGKVDVSQPLFSFNADIVNGKVTFAPSEDAKYNFDIKVQNGSAESFESSSTADAFKVRVNLKNGKVGRG